MTVHEKRQPMRLHGKTFVTLSLLHIRACRLHCMHGGQWMCLSGCVYAYRLLVLPSRRVHHVSARTGDASCDTCIV